MVIGRRRPLVIRLNPVLDFGGVESIFVLQAKFIDRERFDFRVCTFWKDGIAARSIEALGVPVDVLGVDPSIRNPRATLALYRYLRAKRPDIVHASIGEANFHLALTGKLARVPVTIMEETGLPSRSLVGRSVHAGLYRMVDAVVGVSDVSCQYVIQREWAPSRRVHRIHTSAGAEFFEPHTRPPAADNQFRFLAVGRLVDVKNHAMLLRAFRGVLAKRPEARLSISGDGPLRGSLAREIRDLGLENAVDLLGFRSEVLSLFLAADCCVLPSLSEGCSLVLAEAMALGTPVIGSRVGGIPEVMGELGRDWLVGSTDEAGWTQAMLRMMALDPQARVQLRETTQRLAQSFAPAAHIAAIQNLYSTLLER